MPHRLLPVWHSFCAGRKLDDHGWSEYASVWYAECRIHHPKTTERPFAGWGNSVWYDVGQRQASITGGIEWRFIHDTWRAAISGTTFACLYSHGSVDGHVSGTRTRSDPLFKAGLYWPKTIRLPLIWCTSLPRPECDAKLSAWHEADNRCHGYSTYHGGFQQPRSGWMVWIRLFLDHRRFPILMGKGIQVLRVENDVFHLDLSLRDGEYG